MTDFAHQRDAKAADDDDGWLQARYDSLQVVANLSPRPRTVQNTKLAPWGFTVTAPGLIAANVQTVGGTDFGDEGVSFVTQGDETQADVWVYARPGENVAVVTATALPDSATLYLDGEQPIKATGSGRVWQFTLPPRPGADSQIPPPEPVRAGGIKYLWSAALRVPTP